MSNILVTCFSASNTTATVGKNLSEVLQADFYEIKPKGPYTNEDLNWMNKKSRSSIEMNDKNSRPEIIEDHISIEKYETIYLGFPIWWYIAPTIINTFLEQHDFSNKKIILFATSGGSGFGKSIDGLKKSVSSSTKIIEGKVFKGLPSLNELKQWTSQF